MLDPKEWLAAAKKLEVGQSNRIGHTCGEGRCMVVEHTADGWRAWCHRCSEPGWVPHPAESLSERLARLRQAEQVAAQAARTTALPTPAMYDPKDWPLQAKVWLYKAGFPNEEIADMGAYWNPRLQRVVIPVQSTGGDFWLARNVGLCDGPKYLAPKYRPNGVVKYGDGPAIVLVEDVLSMRKVGRVATAIALLGTSMNEQLLSEVLMEQRPLYIWLDPDWTHPDRPGQVAAKKIQRELANFGVEATNIESRADPKLLSTKEIHDAIYASS